MSRGQRLALADYFVIRRQVRSKPRQEQAADFDGETSHVKLLGRKRGRSKGEDSFPSGLGELEVVAWRGWVRSEAGYRGHPRRHGEVIAQSMGGESFV